MKYHQAKQSGVQLQEIPTPTIPAAVCTLGWTEGQVKAYLRDAMAKGRSETIATWQSAWLPVETGA